MVTKACFLASITCITLPSSVKMSAGVEETAEAVPEVGLAVGQVGQVVVAVEAAVALPMTGYRYLGVHHHLCH
jgi:hypothetical protein